MNTAGDIARSLRDPVSQALRGLVAGRVEAARNPADFVLVGLIGRGIQSSRSPAMHEREAARLGLGCSYVLVDFDHLGLADDALPAVLAAGAAAGFQGFNVTHPFKQLIIPHLDALAPEAEAIGAVNTVVYASGRTTGHNTDSWGFAESFRQDMPGVPLARVVQFGAGGAGAAVAHALLGLGVAELVVIDSDPSRAESLATRMRAMTGRAVRPGHDIGREVGEADGIVNTTPVGMAKYPGLPFPAELLLPRHWVAEIIYFPNETALLQLARSMGCRSLSGMGMAVGQAARAFELFTGRKPDLLSMAGHFEAAA